MHTVATSLVRLLRTLLLQKIVLMEEKWTVNVQQQEMNFQPLLVLWSKFTLNISHEMRPFSKFWNLFSRPRCCPNGNFKSLQCFAGLCYCVDEFGRQMDTEIDQNLADTLDCYDVISHTKFDYCCDQPSEKYQDGDFCFEKNPFWYFALKALSSQMAKNYVFQIFDNINYLQQNRAFSFSKAFVLVFENCKYS